MQTITENQFNLLVDEIYNSIMGITMYDSEGNEVEFGMGEMGEVRMQSNEIVNDWCYKANIEIDFKNIIREL